MTTSDTFIFYHVASVWALVRNHLPLGIIAHPPYYMRLIYQKQSASGAYLNAISECWERYDRNRKKYIHCNYRIASD